MPELYLTTAIGGTTCRTAGTPPSSTTTAAAGLSMAAAMRRAAAAPAGEAEPTRAKPLGMNGTSVRQVPAAGQTIDPETGEVIPAVGCRLSATDKRDRKYTRGRLMSRLIGDKALVGCRTWAHAGTSGATAVLTKPGVPNSGSYAGLQTCGRVWDCPHCQAKIAARRAVEIQAAIDQWEDEGGEVLLVTFTTRHGRADPLAVTLGALKDANRRMTRHRAYTVAMGAAGCIGRVMAVEVTHGTANGFHPHYHQLLFVVAGTDRDALKVALDKAWLSGLVANGYTASSARGVRVDGGRAAAGYVSKMGAGERADDWTLANELVQTGAKTGRNGSRGVWEIVDDLGSADQKVKAAAAAVLREYQAATKGLKALTWSRGLKARFAVKEATDEELAAREDDAKVVTTIESDDWRRVVRAGLQSTILTAAEQHGADGVEAILRLLRRDEARAHIVESDDLPDVPELALLE